MIEITKTTNGFLAVFDGNGLYLDAGTVSLPFNSLSLTIDKSGIATFKKSSNGDVFFSGRIGEISFDGTTPDKAGMEAAFAATCLSPIGGGTDIEQRVEALEDTVGDSTSGLVKDVDDLETTVGDSSAGLVHDVNGLNSAVADIEIDVDDVKDDVDVLQTTVGDSTSGLVKDVNDLNTAVGNLELVVGDENGGLVKDVDDIEDVVSSLGEEVEEKSEITSAALTQLRRLIAELETRMTDAEDDITSLEGRMDQAEEDITTLDTVMSAAVNQLS